MAATQLFSFLLNTTLRSPVVFEGFSRRNLSRWCILQPLKPQSNSFSWPYRMSGKNEMIPAVFPHVQKHCQRLCWSLTGEKSLLTPFTQLTYRQIDQFNVMLLRSWLWIYSHNKHASCSSMDDNRYESKLDCPVSP